MRAKSLIIRNMLPEKLIDKIRERSDSLFWSSGSPRTKKRGSSGCMVIECHGSQKLMVLGASNVGKSTICSTYAGADEGVYPMETSLTNNNSKQNEQYKSCVFINGEKIDRVKQFDIEIAVPRGTLWDGTVSGYKKLILESDGYILVYSKENIQSYMKLVELVSDIRKLRKCNVPPIVIVGNKDDLFQDNTVQVKESEHVVLGSFPHFNVSAVENDGVQEAFKCLVQMISQHRILS